MLLLKKAIFLFHTYAERSNTFIISLSDPGLNGMLETTTFLHIDTPKIRAQGYRDAKTRKNIAPKFKIPYSAQ